MTATNLRRLDAQPDTPATSDPVGIPAAAQLAPIDQKESAGAATVARINFVATETCHQLDALTAETNTFRQLILQDAEQVQRAVELLVESGKAASDFAAEGKQTLADLRSNQPRPLAQRGE